MLQEFKEFIGRGSVIDLAVAVIIGGAFGAIITSLVNDIIMPLVGVLLGGVEFSRLSVQVGDAVIAYGNIVQAVVNFCIIALALFLIVRTYNRMRIEPEPEPEAPPEPPAEEVLLAEIRDILKGRSS